MCGINGIISHTLSENEVRIRLKEMGRIESHRGPDDSREDVYLCDNINTGLGFVRLSILDLETGMQPVVCAKDNTAIACNGQIYNYIELKQELSGEPFSTKGDIEVALYLYRRIGTGFLQKLNGMYAGAIYDPVRKKIILFRDRFGIKPLYYTEWDNNFVFSSEIKPLLHGSGLPATLNDSRISTFFTYRYIPGGETMFTGVKRLPPGSYLEYDLTTGIYTIERYWEYRFDNINRDISLEDAAEQFNYLLEDAVRIRLRSDVEVGSLISGGIDSSAVASLAAKARPGIPLFTISFDEERYNELPLVERFISANDHIFHDSVHYKKLCSVESLNELPDIVRSVEEPISLGTLLPTDQVCKLAGEHLKVVLTGEGADEIFAGYRKFLIEMAAAHYNDYDTGGRKRLEGEYPELVPYLSTRDNDVSKRYIRSEQLYGSDELEKLLGKDIASDKYPEDAMPHLSGDEHPLNRAIAFESRARLPDYVIMRLDKLSMRHSLETRTPFLDYRLAEFAAALPVNFKIDLDKGREKFICSYAYDRYNVLDHETAFRKKVPFTIPLADWLSKPASLPDSIKEILSGDMVKRHGILDWKTVHEQVKAVSTFGIGPETLVSAADRVFAVVVFSLWYDAFIKSA